MIKRVPVRKNGPPIIAIHESAMRNGTLLTARKIYAVGGMRNRIPPTNSYFHAITRIIVKIKDGMRCMKRPTTVSRNVYPLPKMSNANMLIKRIAIMPKILGVQ